jgi:hypothetical protein
MHKLTKVVGYTLATIGFACVVKHIMHYKKGCCLCGWHKIKVEDEQQTDSTVSHETKVEEEKKKGTRYGSNPIHY